ncbi:MAG: hypothetical protein IPJ17_06390 [Holophagales bacterium]|nr:MAG: hypothetical protein IPJ17_06390 [Holophagales bacterium]
MNLIESLNDLETARPLWMAAAEAGDLDEARRLVDLAWDWASTHGSPDVRDRLLCNRAALALELGDGQAFVPDLRELLLRSSDRVNCRLASYTLSRAYEIRHDSRKAAFYARIARDASELLGEPEWIASSCNQLGNLLVAENQITEAATQYERALAVIGERSPLRRAVSLYNLGYCRVALGSARDGLRLLLASQRALRSLGAERHQVLCGLDLAFAWLEAGRPDRATRHASRSRQLATRLGETEASKNATYLLGRAAQARGDEASARLFFRQLQSEFFPDAEYLSELLIRHDVLNLVNLRG